MKEAMMPYMTESDWIDVNVYPWGGEYRPDTKAKIFRNEIGFNVVMRSYETEIRTAQTERNSPVCTDSCMEFFFNASPDTTEAYMNFEVNPRGVMYIGFSPTGDRAGTRSVDAPDNSYFNMDAIITDTYWEVRYRIPYAYVKAYFPSFYINKAKYITANFYKCGDFTKHPHYGVWNKVGTLNPDYHQPEYFGKIHIASVTL